MPPKINTLKPPALRPGDTLGIVASSLPLLPSWEVHYHRGIKTLNRLGFQVKEGQTIQLRRWWSAGTPQQQAQDINQMFADPQIKGLVSLAGGFSAIHVLEHLDYDLIRRNPKPFVGMSDNTLYHLAMYSQCGLVGFQGNSLVEGFAEAYDQATPAGQVMIQDLYSRWLTSPQPLGVLPHLTQWKNWRSGTAEGPLFGGVLRRLIGLAGTPYFPPVAEFENAILFWEEIGETLYDICLNLKRLKYMGILERISGMVIGKLIWVNQFFDEIEHPSPQEAILDALTEYNFPILAEVDFAHQQTMIPLPIGLQAYMNSEQLLLEIKEGAVR